MPQLGQGRNMVRGGPAVSSSRPVDLGEGLGNQIQELGGGGGLAGLVKQLGQRIGGFDPGWRGEVPGGPRGNMLYPGGGVNYFGGSPTFDESERGFDPGGRSAATLQKQWSDLDPTAQQGYIKQYQAATPQMQASVLSAMGLGGRGGGVGDPTGAIPMPKLPGGPYRSPAVGLPDSGPMGPAAVADNARRLKGSQGGGGLDPALLGGQTQEPESLGMPGPWGPGGGDRYLPPATGGPGGTLTAGQGSTLGRAPAAAPPTLGGGIGGLSGLAARPRKALGSAAQDYFG